MVAPTEANTSVESKFEISRSKALGLIVCVLIAGAALVAQWIENEDLKMEVETLRTEQKTAREQFAVVALKLEEDATKQKKELSDQLGTLSTDFEQTRQQVALLQFQSKRTNLAKQIELQKMQASSIAALFKSGKAAGVVWQGKSREALANEVWVGRVCETGVFKGNNFGCGGSAKNTLQSGSFRFLGWKEDGDGVFYDPEGSQPPLAEVSSN